RCPTCFPRPAKAHSPGGTADFSQVASAPGIVDRKSAPAPEGRKDFRPSGAGALLWPPLPGADAAWLNSAVPPGLTSAADAGQWDERSACTPCRGWPDRIIVHA